MLPDIIIPTCKSNVDSLIDEIRLYVPKKCKIIATCMPVSASKNRNRGLMMSDSELVIMIDDDITGFYKDWYENLIKFFTDDIAIIAARLLKQDGSLAYMLSNNNSLKYGCVEAEKKEVPTACVLFRNDRTRFDEFYIGSGFEDNDFCLQLARNYPRKLFVVNNECRLVHLNEKKNQGGKFWKYNKLYFNSKWKLSR